MTGQARIRARRGVIAAYATAVLMAGLVAPHVSASPGDHVKADPAVGFTPASNPVIVHADRGHIINLKRLLGSSRIRLANGTMSPPDTYFLQFEYLLADNAAISQHVNGRSLTLTNLNGRDATTAARLGATGGTMDVWTTIDSLKLCVTPQTFYTVASTYEGMFGGRFAEVWALIATVFEPYLHGPLKNVGPCLQLKELVPLLSVFVEAGVPLPDDLPGEKIDLKVYAVHIQAPRTSTSLSLPLAHMAVDND